MIPRLRDYQRDAVDAVFDFWGKRPGNPLVEVPTGGGKSLILAAIAIKARREYGARVLVATHRAELIRQDASAISSLCPDADVGIYSSSLSSRKVTDITVAGVQSVCRRAHVLGAIDVIIVDEAHLVNPKASTQYARLFDDLRKVQPGLSVVGLTATPYRLGSGLLTVGEGKIFDAIAYKIDVMTLVDAGHLSTLTTARTSITIDTTSARTTSMGDFATNDLELASDIDEVTDAVADDVSAHMAKGRKHALIYGVSVEHVAHLRNAIRMRGISCEMITGETQPGERARIVAAYKDGTLQSVASCDVLTTGFDAPATDLLVVVRPTQSAGLYVQIMGRGMRCAPGKNDCLVLDYGGNIARHGPITDVKIPSPPSSKGGDAPTKVCPECNGENAAGVRACVYCDFEFPLPEKKANKTASKLSPMERKALQTTHTVDVVELYGHEGKTGTHSLRVEYWSGKGFDTPMRVAREWVCLDHHGFARDKAERWWRDVVGTKVPASVTEALDRADEMPEVTSITTEPDGEWTRVVSMTKSANPAPRQEDAKTMAEAQDDADGWYDDDLPF